MFSISRIIWTVPSWLAALALFCATTALVPDSARAQTARVLKCKTCVGAREIKKRAIKSNRLRDGAVGLPKLEPGFGGTGQRGPALLRHNGQQQ